MWARVVELLLAVWLALSPFIFPDSTQEIFLWTCALLVALFALLSFWNSLGKMHLVTLGVALALLGLGYRTFPEISPPPQENATVVGLLLLMLAIVPSHAHRPPRSWQAFLNKKR